MFPYGTELVTWCTVLIDNHSIMWT